LTQHDVLNFDEPWQAEALGLAMALIEEGRFSNAEWSASLGAAIKRAMDSGATTTDQRTTIMCWMRLSRSCLRSLWSRVGPCQLDRNGEPPTPPYRTDNLYCSIRGRR
jgi:hypothetical protein